MSNVVEIKVKNLNNIGARLRELADWAEKNPDAVQTVMVISAANDEIVSVHGYGQRTSPLEAQGWLAMAQQYLYEPMRERRS